MEINGTLLRLREHTVFNHLHVDDKAEIQCSDSKAVLPVEVISHQGLLWLRKQDL